MRNLRFLPILLLATLGNAAHAQLVFGSTTSVAGSSGGFYLDLATAKASPLWSGSGSRKVNGLAADEVGGVIYGNDAARLYKWNYGTVGTVPAQISGFYRKGSDGVVYATGVDELAFAKGSLYAYTNENSFGGTNVADGFYKIDTSVVAGGAVTNMSLVWEHPDLLYNFEGFGYSGDASLFYAANSGYGALGAKGSTQADLGIYVVDLKDQASTTVTKIADFDPFVFAPDGITVGGGHIWMSQKPINVGEVRIAGYNLATKTYDAFYSLALNDITAGRATGLAWAPGANPVPEPATITSLGLGALALLRRRRKA